MPNFHALAVFDACGPSTENIQEAVSSLFDAFSHPRVRYHEHEMSEGPGNSAPDKSYCMVFVDCDVDAYTEEKALDFANDAFEHISTETCEYLALGLIPGRQRVQRRGEESSETDADERGGRRHVQRRGEESSETDADERGGRRRSTRGRGRRRRDDQERDEGARQETGQTQVRAAAARPAAETNETPRVETPRVQKQQKQDIRDLEVEPVETPRVQKQQKQQKQDIRALEADLEVEPEVEPVEAPTELEVEASEPSAPPPRSSHAMQVTVTVKLRASELQAASQDASNDEAPPTPEDLVRMAVTEARNRHPEVPADVAPESESTSLSGGDTLLSLTWKYPAPVPSSKEDSA